MRLYRLLLPLGLLAFTACKTTPKSSSDTLFTGGEHKILGDDAYKAACEGSAHCPDHLPRRDGKVSFTYGELVAFSGDFYDQPFAFYDEKHEQSLLHPTAANTKRIRELFKEEEAAARRQMEDPNVSYPDSNLGFFYAFPKYLELAKQNVTHFGWHNLKMYVTYHGKAIDLALEARSAPSEQEKRKLWIQTLYMNAFADHFLTDSFATGHIRNPRKQAIDWQLAKGYSRTAVDALAKLVHDHDHLLKETHGPGLNVLNARGDNWHTRCDGELFVLAQKSDPQVAIPTEAVRVSLEEVLRAFESGETPDGVYRATEYVPFLAAGEEPLIEIFHPNLPEEQIQSWLNALGVINTMSWFVGLNTNMAREFFAALPDLMQKQREEIARESSDPELQKRLAPAYIEGFKSIQ